mmetsp:Transcript_19829/g.55266  ORF Transcript_19829/g.55266 Transcript_19829/m.55266 type:complete len:224 (-) Transcript_19829:229-900(-)
MDGLGRDRLAAWTEKRMGRHWRLLRRIRSGWRSPRHRGTRRRRGGLRAKFCSGGGSAFVVAAFHGRLPAIDEGPGRGQECSLLLLIRVIAIRMLALLLASVLNQLYQRLANARVVEDGKRHLYRFEASQQIFGFVLPGSAIIVQCVLVEFVDGFVGPTEILILETRHDAGEPLLDGLYEGHCGGFRRLQSRRTNNFRTWIGLGLGRAHFESFVQAFFPRGFWF